MVFFTADEWEKIKQNHYIHELGRVCNISSDYETTIRLGLEARKLEAREVLQSCRERGDREGCEFLSFVIRVINAIEAWADKYAREAERQGLIPIVTLLRQIPRYGARSFHEALQFFRILHFALWCSGNYHNTIGRLDQYLYPYFQTDLEVGRLDEAGAFELLEEFLISFNKGSDLYPGMQQGDNGQSLVLGEVDSEGKPVYNALRKCASKPAWN
jgi:pyruvate-formate lyase